MSVGLAITALMFLLVYSVVALAVYAFGFASYAKYHRTIYGYHWDVQDGIMGNVVAGATLWPIGLPIFIGLRVTARMKGRLDGLVEREKQHEQDILLAKEILDAARQEVAELQPLSVRERMG